MSNMSEMPAGYGHMGNCPRDAHDDAPCLCGLLTLAADAARFRWLEERVAAGITPAFYAKPKDGDVCYIEHNEHGDNTFEAHGPTLRRAVDAAMKTARGV
jgi:hypothetical protein